LEKGILDALIEGKANVAFFSAKGLKARGFQQTENQEKFINNAR